MVKNIITICLLFCFSIIGFSACEKYAEDTPQAIKKLVQQQKRSIIYVAEYKCNGEMVYFFHPVHHPDALAIVYDKEGNFLCDMGGVDGRNTCTEVCEYMIEIRVVWINGK